MIFERLDQLAGRSLLPEINASDQGAGGIPVMLAEHPDALGKKTQPNGELVVGIAEVVECGRPGARPHRLPASAGGCGDHGRQWPQATGGFPTVTEVFEVHVPQEAVIDLVFIHGLDGDARRSWSAGPPESFWPLW
jgi:hypothetical protein